MRIGIIGTENSHVDHIIDYLNVRGQQPDTRVVALSGGRGERNEKLAAAGNIERIVDEPAQLLGEVDSVIITDRHGGLHREHAEPFLRQGLPVLVDKPLACGTADAQAILDTANEHDALVTSYSAVRFVPDTDALVHRADGIGDTQVVMTTGPADPASEYGGIFFYGIHPVDVALRLAPGPLTDIAVRRSADTITVTALAGDIRVVTNFVLPDKPQVPFHAAVVGRNGVAASDLVLGRHYVSYGLAVFFEMIRTGVRPISDEDLLRPIQLLEAVGETL